MKKLRKPIIGIVALVVAIIGLAASIFGSDIAEAIQPSPPIEEKLADFTVRLKDTVVAKLKNQDAVNAAPVRERDWHTTIPKVAMGLGMLGLICAAVSYTRGEPRAFAVSAAGFGVVALAWQAMMISLVAILIILIVFAVMNSLGMDLSF